MQERSELRQQCGIRWIIAGRSEGFEHLRGRVAANVFSELVPHIVGPFTFWTSFERTQQLESHHVHAQEELLVDDLDEVWPALLANRVRQVRDEGRSLP